MLKKRSKIKFSELPIADRIRILKNQTRTRTREELEIELKERNLRQQERLAKIQKSLEENGN